MCVMGAAQNPARKRFAAPPVNGAGEVRQVQKTFLGSIVHTTACPQCQGRGEVISTPCHNCSGNGRIKSDKDDLRHDSGGGRRRVANSGAWWKAMQANPAHHPAIYMSLSAFRDHDYFKRRNNDIILDISINVAQATLGDVIRIPTVEDEIDLTIPAGTQTGKVFRLRGKGVPRLRRRWLQFWARRPVGICTGCGPPTVDPKNNVSFSKNWHRHWARTFNHRANNRGFFDRVMDFFAGEQQ